MVGDPSTWTDAEALSYSETHVAYEVRMFFQAVDALRGHGRPHDEAAIGTSATPTGHSRTNVQSTAPGPSRGTSGVHTLTVAFTPQQFRLHTCLEVFMVHLRNLIDFLDSTRWPGQKGDVLAGHFCDGWQADIPKNLPSLDEARKRIHKELAHLTTRRFPDGSPEKVWSVDRLAGELRLLLNRFVTEANDKKLSRNVRAAMG